MLTTLYLQFRSVFADQTMEGWGAQTEVASSAGPYVATTGSPQTGTGGIVTMTTGSLGVGTHPITAVFGGNASFNSATSNTLAQVIRAPIYDAGTVSLTVDGTTASATFGQGSTAGSIAQTIAEGFWLMPSSAVAVSAVGGQVTMAAAAGGSGSGYAYSVTTTYDSGDFAAASFSPSSTGGDLSGAESNVQVPIYAYNAAGGYDANGNVLAYTDTVMGPWSFGYDQLNRLVTAQNGDAYLAGTPDPPAHAWAANFCCAYDAFGNRLARMSNRRYPHRQGCEDRRMEHGHNGTHGGALWTLHVE